jgi:hypothetical protein
MWLFGRAAPERITKQLAEIEEFPMSPTVDQPGWTRPHYALRDRQVFSPGTSIDTVTAVFAAAPSTPATAGTLKNWRRRVAFRLTGQALPSFMMALPFVGPLLDVIGRQQSVIFELIGAAGTGKTSLQKIAAGTPERFEDLLTGGHDYLARYAGSLLLVDDPQLALAGVASSRLATQVRDVVANLSRVPQPLVCLIAARTSLLDHVGAESSVGQAIEDRIISLRIGDRLFGVFDSIPDDEASASEFADALCAAAQASQGAPIQAYLQRLVQDRADDEAGLRERLSRFMQSFRDKSGADPDDGPSVRVADAFALVYAAGRLAQDYGVLPEDWKVGPAILRCFKEHRVGPAAPRSYLEQLEEIAAGADVIHLRRGVSVEPELVAAAQVFVRHRAQGRELLIRAAARQEVLQAWKRQQPPPGLAALLILEDGHFTVKRRLHKGAPERVYAFRLPPEQAE